MKKILSLLTLTLFSSALFAAQSSRSDSIDIRHIKLELDVTDYTTKILKGHASLDIRSLINGQNAVKFDLQGFSVDSAKWDGQNVTYNLVGSTLTLTSPTTFNAMDSAVVEIFYQGVPPSDAYWGGFYYVGAYAFNLGVGFVSQPHSFGRAWHPCFDNMVERSSYEFFVRTTNDKRAVCNGILIDSVIQTNSDIIWHHKLDEHIPSYLASLAVSNYIIVEDELTGNNGITPVRIACEAIDTNNVDGSFAHLQQSFDCLEEHFGTHSWPHVGYSLVPFGGGAMEHATNIHIGKVYINGGLNYETLIAHELTHHWWGDLVTCSTVEDMWLNEGFASYGELLHTEKTYGAEAYKTAYKNLHYNVITTAHINDDGYRAISPMDSNYTYGTTVYSKGSDVIHSMRTYLGDSLFDDGLTAFLNANKFSAVSSTDLRDFLNVHTGVNMTNYFDDWIFQSGFPHYSIDSIQSTASASNYDVNVFIRHRKHEAPNYYNGVPLEIGVYDDNWNLYIYNIMFSGRCMQLNLQLPFDPTMIIIDPNSKISDAITEEDYIITGTGVKNMPQAKARVLIQNTLPLFDSTYLRIEHSWIPPDRFKTNPQNGYVLNNTRYWKIDGIDLDKIEGLVQFHYDGSGNSNYLDSSWVKNDEDSIALFYRKDLREEWTLVNDSLKVFNPNDKIGSTYIKEIKAGEYCFGIKRSGFVDPLQSDYASGNCQLVTKIEDRNLLMRDVKIYPNPTRGTLNIRAEEAMSGNVVLYTMNGQEALRSNLGKRKTLHIIDVSSLSKGIYFLNIINTKGEEYREKIIIQ